MDDIFYDLNPEQREAALHNEGPLLVLAGAGSGKTRVVTLRIARLISEGVDPHAILALTFTNKAAQEMRERVNKLTHKRVSVSTFHSFGARVLRESIHELGFPSHFSIYDEDDSAKIIKYALGELGIKEKKGDLKTYQSLISKIKNDLVLDSGADEDLGQDISSLFHLYQARLKECGALDFDDLLYLTVKLLKEFPHVRELYQKRFDYVLIDEYQDTNIAQDHLVKLLLKEPQNIFIVGDPDQSIYSWRGATISNIMNFQNDYPEGKIIRLEQNYRSHNVILKAANSLIDHNKNRFEKELWSAKGEGSKIGLYTGYDEREEASFVARQIERLSHKYPLNEMVIFYRTNAQSRPFEDALLERGLSYHIVGGVSFYQRKEIKDILAFLRVVSLPADYVAFARTINLPKRGIGEATLEKIRENAEKEQIPILEYIGALVKKEPLQFPEKFSAKVMSGLSSYYNLIQTIKSASREVPLFQLVKMAIEESEYLDYLKKDDPESFSDRRENLNELIAKAIEYEGETSEKSLVLFLEELSLKSATDKDLDDDKVTFMTLHNGKGLEFQVVFVGGLEEELLPHANSYKSPDAIEEERRLCYVGMTRAKDLLFLTHCHVRFLWGFQRTQRPSRFLREIDEEYIERVRRPYG